MGYCVKIGSGGVLPQWAARYARLSPIKSSSRNTPYERSELKRTVALLTIHYIFLIPFTTLAEVLIINHQ
jgi:hypothetical protein